MEKIKLYTEEQIKNALNEICLMRDIDIFDFLNDEKPIELPSDEEIRNELQFASRDYFFGALWMKEQIKQQANEYK